MIKSPIKHILVIWSLVFCFAGRLPCFDAYAQEDSSLTELTKKITEATGRKDLYLAFEDLTDFYFKGNKYDMYIGALRSLIQKKKELEPTANYFIALSRYTQLKYLEETQNWEEYFSKNNEFRGELVSAAEGAIKGASPDDPLGLYARFLVWRFHDDQKDAFSETSLSDLLQAVRIYASKTNDLVPLKDIADQLLEYAQKAKAQEAYRLYVDKLLTSGAKDEELKASADNFYQAGNSDLAQVLYDAYIEKIAGAGSKEKIIPLLVEIASKFSIEGNNKIQDAAYASKLYQKIESAGGKEAFDEQLLYARAYNSEKSKDFALAKEYYEELLQRFPQTTHADEATFKIAIIATYVARDVASGKAYFEKLAQKQAISPQVISGLYQLGVLNQWKGELVAAKKYYTALIEKAGEGFKETVGLAKERLKEISGAAPIEYNLKTFLDASLKEDAASFDANKISLQCTPYRQAPAKDVTIASATYTTESGCMPVEIQYLWSGHIGQAAANPTQPTFTTSYIHPGTKEVNLAVISPAGTVERNLDMIDVE